MGGAGLARLNGGLFPQLCLKAPRDSGASFRQSDWCGSLGPPAKAPWAPRPPPWAALSVSQATGQALGRVIHLPPPSAPSSFLQGPARAGNGAYPDPIRMLARLLPAALPGRAEGLIPGSVTTSEARWWEHSCGALPRVQASRLVDPDTPEW